MAARSIGIPIKLIHEAEGHTVTVESKTGAAPANTLPASEPLLACLARSFAEVVREQL